MRAVWLFHRRAALAVAVGLVLVAVVGIAAIIDGPGRGPVGTVASSPSARRGSSPTTPPAAPATAAYTPSTVEPAETAVQRSIDNELARAESPSSIEAAEALTLPVGRDSPAYPAVPTASREDAFAYASSFAAELLDRNYRAQSRGELLAWAQAEEAANTLPGVPASIANKALSASLADPGIAGGNGASPVPSLAVWTADARSGMTQRVTGLLVAVDPSWTQIVAKGWEPRDPLMTIMDVTGTLTVRTADTTASHQVSMVLALGSCDRAPGLGAMAVQDWMVR
jgi:hypothetical protein